MAVWAHELVRTLSAQARATSPENRGSRIDAFSRAQLPQAGLRMVEHVLAPKMLAAPMHRHSREDEYSPDMLPVLAAEYGAEVDFEATMPLVERHGLLF